MHQILWSKSEGNSEVGGQMPYALPPPPDSVTFNSRLDWAKEMKSLNLDLNLQDHVTLECIYIEIFDNLLLANI